MQRYVWTCVGLRHDICVFMQTYTFRMNEHMKIYVQDVSKEMPKILFFQE